MTYTFDKNKGVATGIALRNGNATRVRWAGQTTNNTAKELFLDGDSTSESRLIIPTGLVLIGEGHFAAYNVTDGTVFATGRFAVSLKNLAGTVSAEGTTLEWDAASVDANPFVQYFSGSSGFVWTYDNTNKALVLTVTGTAAKVINWRAEITQLITIRI